MDRRIARSHGKRLLMPPLLSQTDPPYALVTDASLAIRDSICSALWLCSLCNCHRLHIRRTAVAQNCLRVTESVESLQLLHTNIKTHVREACA